MIHVDLAPEPETFDEQVRNPGMLAVAELAGETPDPKRKAGRPFRREATTRAEIPAARLPTYWTRCLDNLMSAYQRICAYCCFAIHPVTGARSVDHMAPKSQSWDRAYEWDNYRLASARLNARKNDFADVLDPFEVQNGWYTLELLGFQLCPGAGLAADLRQRILDTIARLGLNASDMRERREADAEGYWRGDFRFDHLMSQSPFVARELQRQGRLRTALDIAEP